MCRLVLAVLVAVLLPHFVAALPPPSAIEIDRLIKQLGSESFADREAASKALAAMGERPLAPLRAAEIDAKDLEVRKRAGRLVPLIEAQIHETESRRLKGRWRAVALEVDGRSVPTAQFTWDVRFDDDAVYWRRTQFSQYRKGDGSAVFHSLYETEDGAYRLGHFRGGKAIEVRQKEQAQRVLARGIFAEESGSLRLCLDLSGRTRPERFETRPGTSLVVLTLKRQP